MNGLRPDFVLLSPRKGIAVYEVKDWNLSALDYRYSGDPPKLIASDGKKKFSLGVERDPVAKMLMYKSEVFNLYCPSLGRNHGFGAIVGGIVFPFAKTEHVRELLMPAIRQHSLHKYPRHNLVIGCDVLDAEPSDALKRMVLPPIFSFNLEMSEDVADDLRHWLVEPEPPKAEKTRQDYLRIGGVMATSADGRQDSVAHCSYPAPEFSGGNSAATLSGSVSTQ